MHRPPRRGLPVTTVAARDDVKVACPATAFLPYERESCPAARRLVRDKLCEWGLEQLIDDAELIISELVSNTLKTGCLTQMVVAIRRPTDRTVRLSVRDGSRSLPVWIDAGPNAEGGRGLDIVHKLTKGRWGVSADPFGKTVHASLEVPSRAG